MMIQFIDDDDELTLEDVSTRSGKRIWDKHFLIFNINISLMAKTYNNIYIPENSLTELQLFLISIKLNFS